MEPLSPAARRDLRAKAHHLEPVVTVGHHGLTPPVLHEIDLALLAHELIKVRVLGDDRDAREAILAQAVSTLDCAPVQHVGKVLVLWRPNPEKKVKVRPAPAPTPSRPAKKAPTDAVRARRRATTPAWGSTPTPASGKGRRGAARHGPAPETTVREARQPAPRATATTTRGPKAPVPRGPKAPVARGPKALPATTRGPKAPSATMPAATAAGATARKAKAPAETAPAASRRRRTGSA